MVAYNVVAYNVDDFFDIMLMGTEHNKQKNNKALLAKFLQTFIYLGE